MTPLTGETIGALPTSTPDDVVTAYELARAAQQEWAQRDVRERVEFLTRLHDLVLDRQDELLDLIQIESGKARIQAFEEVLDTAGVCRHYAKKAPSYLAERKALGALPVLTQ
ncbi:aldehyde dehydrogenase family protein, partial [Escherichia coli]